MHGLLMVIILAWTLIRYAPDTHSREEIHVNEQSSCIQFFKERAHHASYVKIDQRWCVGRNRRIRCIRALECHTHTISAAGRLPNYSGRILNPRSPNLISENQLLYLKDTEFCQEESLRANRTFKTLQNVFSRSRRSGGIPENVDETLADKHKSQRPQSMIIFISHLLTATYPISYHHEGTCYN